MLERKLCLCSCLYLYSCTCTRTWTWPRKCSKSLSVGSVVCVNQIWTSVLCTDFKSKVLPLIASYLRSSVSSHFSIDTNSDQSETLLQVRSRTKIIYFFFPVIEWISMPQTLHYTAKLEPFTGCWVFPKVGYYSGGESYAILLWRRPGGALPV